MNQPIDSQDTTNAISVHGVSKQYRLWHDSKGPVQYAIASGISAITGRVPPQGKYFQDFHALSNVSFTVKRGQSFAIIGQNGSGKSTLLQIIAGTLKATAGRFHVRGRVAALLELGSGFNPEFTGRENVYLYAAILGLSRFDIESRFDAIAQFADIGDFIEQPVKIYSSGMALRLAFAVIAHIDATVLIIDEALAVGDVSFVQKCMRFLRQFREQGTLLFVSHDMSAVRSLCNSALWLETGAAKMLGSAQDVAAAYLAESNLGQKNADVVEIKTSPIEPLTAPVAETSPDVVLPRLPPVRVKNVLSLSLFNADSASFGDGRIKIVDVGFVDRQGTRINTVNGGDVVNLTIVAKGVQPTGNVIFGFNLKDRLGQYLFGENTSHRPNSVEVILRPDECCRAIFTFQMPLLHRGQYSIAAAVASGIPENHRQQQWIHEAMVISSATEWAHAGLVGLPMLNIAVEKL